METDRLRPLDNCEVFHQIKNAFHKYDEETKKFKTFNYWSGNEENIAQLCEIVGQILLEHKLVMEKPHARNKVLMVLKPAIADGSLDQLRGLWMFLVLNSRNKSECEADKLAEWNPQCVHLINQLPQMPQFLTIGLALRCGLELPMQEFLSCGPAWLTRQYYECLNETLSHVSTDKFDILEMLSGALKAAGQAVYLEIQPQVGLLMQRHLLDSVERLRELTSKQRKLYLGEAMRQMLDINLGALQKSQEQQPLPHYFPLYQLQQTKDPPPLKLRHGYKLILTLLDALQRILQLVSVDTFMYWMELPTDQLLYRLQEWICLQSSQLLKLMAQQEDLQKHSISKQLQTFAEAAKTFEQRLQELTLGELLSFLDGDERMPDKSQLEAGLDELFQRSIAFGNDECLQTMSNYVGLLKMRHAQLILEHLGQVVAAKELDEGIKEEPPEHMCSSDEEDDDPYFPLIRQVLFPIFKVASVPDKLKLLKLRDDMLLWPHFRFTPADHQQRRILFFNKLNSQRLPLQEFLELCFEHPPDTWLGLAQLAMAHPQYSSLFWQLASQCAAHITHHLSHSIKQLLQDDRMLLNHNSSHFLLALYMHPLILNGMKCSRRIRRRGSFVRRLLKLRLNLRAGPLPYTAKQLKASQSQFLEACALGLCKFSASSNYAAIQKIMRTLLALNATDEHIQARSQEQLRQLRLQQKQKTAAAGSVISSADVNVARNYAAMHGKLTMWRRSYWPLISQLMLTLDALRWDLSNFQQPRVDALGLVERYWKENTPHAVLMPEGLFEKIEAMVDSLQHKDFWLQNQPKMLAKPHQLRQYVQLLTQSSATEATNLFRSALTHKIDKAVMIELAQTVANHQPIETALNAYNHLFRCYISAFQDHLPLKLDVGQRPGLVEHLLEIIYKSPQQVQGNTMWLAQSVLLLLHKKSNDEDKTKIVHYMNLMPQNASTRAVIAEMEAI